MEFLFEIVAEIVTEVLFAILFEFLAHYVGAYLEGVRHLDIKKWLYPVLFSVIGFGLGWFVSLFWPVGFVSKPYLALFYVFVLPLFPALVLPLLRVWRRKKGLVELEVDKFLNGYLLLLMFFTARMICAVMSV
jgi:hypothetical protein